MQPLHRLSYYKYLLAIGGCLVTTAIALPLVQWFDLVNIVMLFLLAVFFISLRLGKRPAVLAAFLSVALFDFFFVPPALTLAVSDAQYLLTFAVMLTVALITAQLTAGLKSQAEMVAEEECRTRALYEMAKSLSGALDVPQVAQISQTFLRDVAQLQVTLLLPDTEGKLKPFGDHEVWTEPHTALVAYEAANPQSLLPEVDGMYYYTLRGSTRNRGVLAVATSDKTTVLMNQHHLLLEAVASLIAIALERLHYVEVAQQAQLQMTVERLRSSVLSALSHDLRTPLTIMVGLADQLAVSRPSLEQKQKVTAEALRDQALRLTGLVANLLDMARLQGGKVMLRREWQPLEEVVGASLNLLERALSEHPVHVELPPDLPLLEFDAVLIERVLCNLLENAAKYSPAGMPIHISAQRSGDNVMVSVRDYGNGIPDAHLEHIFDMFVRGVPESPVPGVGLGLAICRAIIEAHGGTITVDNCGAGACFIFTLPVGESPLIEDDDKQDGLQ